MALTDTVILFTGLYIVHRCFHKVNILGFIAIGILLVALGNYMVEAMHINQLTAMVVTIAGYPLFSFLLASSIKGFRKKANDYPFVAPQYLQNLRQ